MDWDGSIVFFGAPDLSSVASFYGELLELPLYKDQGVCRIYQIPGGGMIGFCNHIKPIRSQKSPIITLLTDQVDEVYKRVVEAGHSATPPTLNETFHIYHFFLDDPHGYTVEIQRFV